MSLFGSYDRRSTGFINTSPGPLDGQSIYDSIEDALLDIRPDTRVKGQRITVKGNEGEKPTEYWFVKDYQPRVMSTPPPFPPVEISPEFIPNLENGGLVLYQPGGGELPPLSGETIMASLDPNFPYKSFDKVAVEPEADIFCETAASHEAA